MFERSGAWVTYFRMVMALMTCRYQCGCGQVATCHVRLTLCDCAGGQLLPEPRRQREQVQLCAMSQRRFGVQIRRGLDSEEGQEASSADLSNGSSTRGILVIVTSTFRSQNHCDFDISQPREIIVQPSAMPIVSAPRLTSRKVRTKRRVVWTKVPTPLARILGRTRASIASGIVSKSRCAHGWGV